MRILLLTALVSLAASVAGAQDTPRFSSSVEVMSVDVTVVDGRGQPVLGLSTGDFTVRVNDVPRRVLSAEWVPLGVTEGVLTATPPAGYSSNENAAAGRLILIVVDQPNIRFGGTASLRAAVNEFVDRLHPSDRLAVIGIGLGSASTSFTADRERAKRAVAQMTGQRRLLDDGRRDVATSEAVGIYQGDPVALQTVVRRECDGLEGRQFEDCIVTVENTSSSIAVQALADTRQTISSLRALLNGLKLIETAKTLVLVSEGFVMGDEMQAVMELGPLAAESRTSIYALKLDHQMFDASRVRPSTAPLEDRRMMAEGLETLAGVARGTLFDVSAGASMALDRIASEISGYYLLGLETDPRDSRSRRNAVNVSVARRGTSVRWRRELAGPGLKPPPASPREAVLNAMRSPLMLSALPLQVATFSLRDPDPAKVQLLLHAEIGTDYASPRAVSIGYAIFDADGRIVESQSASAQLPPVMNGVPSPLLFRGGASLPSGEYTLRLAVAEGERVGSVEHSIHAGLVRAGQVDFSELMIGGPALSRDPLRPTVGHFVSFGLLHGYIEAYGPNAAALQVKYEIARDADGPAVLSADVKGQSVGGERVIFTQMMPIRQLPGGRYTLRATISRPGSKPLEALKTMTRVFEVAPPAVLMTSAEGGSTPAPGPTELFLPVGTQMIGRVFRRDDASRPDVLDGFRARVAEPARSAFDGGVVSLAAGDYARAEASFKSAIQLDTDSAAPLAYLAATFAASGRDEQAAGAWQTALIDGSDLPQIYVWLGDALIRNRDLAQARSILEEAVATWPSDVRFAKPLALLYATFGLGREAVRTMERHLLEDPDDGEALSLAVEWIFHLHASGAVARTRADDVKAARTYAEAYERANGPQVALVREWVRALEEGRR
jgi:VWFA-related protein